MAGRKKPSPSMVGEGSNAMEDDIQGGEHHHCLHESYFARALHGGRDLAGTLREKEREITQKEGRWRWDKNNQTQYIKKTTIIWDELNTSFIPKSKPIISFMIVSYYRDQYNFNRKIK